MIRRISTILTALSALLATTACEDAPDEAVIVSDPVLEAEREEAAPLLTPEDLQPVAGTTNEPPGATPQLAPPAVAVLAVEIECDEAAVFFETDAAELGPEDEQKLDRLAACLQGTEEQEQVEITGRADPRASEPYNEELSRERAQAVAEYLRTQGVADGSFEVRAMGEQGAVEGMPILWPAQRHAMIEPTDPGQQGQQGLQGQQAR